jgi:predicted CopG family antitoxin
MSELSNKLEKEIETKKLTTISISKENYLILKRMGQTSDSFNDVLNRLLKNKMLESDSRVGTP